MSEPTDVELITRIKLGEPAALETLYDRYAPRMLGVAVRLVGQREAAEDILQESFFQVWQRAAARLRLPEGTIHTRARSALRKLRVLIEPAPC